MITYREFRQPLTALYDQAEATAIARLVLETAFGLTWADILSDKVTQLSADDEAKLRKIQKKILDGQPVQYAMGRAEFCERWFDVTPAVLIPRPETQWLCHAITDAWGIMPREGSILDIGTGSGCIAATVALGLRNSPVEVVGWDVSHAALAVARRNARRLGAEVTFVKQDALYPPDDHDRWDVIVSNPPYVCQSEQAGMERHVLDHEPHLALFVPDDDPLRFYRSIARYAVKALKAGGELLLEINRRFGDDTARLMLQQGFSHVEIKTDDYGNDRFITAIRP